ncbi:hypothetical protein AQPE_2076 [Aquipluma nitroreducens]|uniref:Lipoprotein n=1 Tax=Aquipluma nitroreducens TaxID=2010828 RepID=A0A5K7S8U2_9BACT|nr:hypothetical protein [Aquipluma nitroreducens]BBE17917.1 hypothetical protein AQPE_2076 [Aquipluma nitroreducens]
MKTLSVLKYLLVFFFFAGIGCEETIIEQGFTIGRETNFQVNQLYTSANGQYTLKITEIKDSRCAEGVQCVWQGEVILKGEWTENNNKSSFEIHSVVSDQTKEPIGYTIKIVDAKPYPKYGTVSKPEDLVVTLLIQKK